MWVQLDERVIENVEGPKLVTGTEPEPISLRHPH